MAAPEGTTMDNAIDATTGVVGRAYATYKELYTTKDYPAEGIRVDTLVDTSRPLLKNCTNQLNKKEETEPRCYL